MAAASRQQQYQQHQPSRTMPSSSLTTICTLACLLLLTTLTTFAQAAPSGTRPQNAASRRNYGFESVHFGQEAMPIQLNNPNKIKQQQQQPQQQQQQELSLSSGSTSSSSSSSSFSSSSSSSSSSASSQRWLKQLLWNSDQQPNNGPAVADTIPIVPVVKTRGKSSSAAAAVVILPANDKASLVREDLIREKAPSIKVTPKRVRKQQQK